ncbi:MAG: ATP phosphoribosyltransferase regulatory subunit [Ignavibacteria bacterium]|nr:ATP phosphoribosyltransferase regulatory subunit [Ignavibacteria bacterium]
MFIQKPKGTYDLLPGKSFQKFHRNKTQRSFLISITVRSGLRHLKTSLFRRGIGEETDIVSKEMYSFNEDEVTVKPEMTAPVIRAYLENSLYSRSPLKGLFYISNMFRVKERPQAGRFREFSQYGAEAIGSGDYLIDAEMILLADTVLKKFGIDDSKIKINTIGSLTEREKLY